MNINLLYLLIIFIFINIRSFYLMWNDKRIAIANANVIGKDTMRIPEAVLLLNALLFGFVGIGLGMSPLLRHKSRKSYFLWGLPVIAIFNVLLFYFAYQDLQAYFNIYFSVPL
ncbi:MAG: DUF1294 domain-containing protein [Chitinophagales bacterium]